MTTETKPAKRAKAQRRKTIEMIARLGLTESDFAWRSGSTCVDDAILKSLLRIRVIRCENATMIGRSFDISVVMPTKLHGRCVRNRAPFEIECNKLDFVIVQKP